MIILRLGTVVESCSESGSGAEARPSGDPVDWTVEEVIGYIASVSPQLAGYAELFRRHVSPHLSKAVLKAHVHAYVYPHAVFCQLHRAEFNCFFG